MNSKLSELEVEEKPTMMVLGACRKGNSTILNSSIFQSEGPKLQKSNTKFD